LSGFCQSEIDCDMVICNYTW